MSRWGLEKFQAAQCAFAGLRVNRHYNSRVPFVLFAEVFLTVLPFLFTPFRLVTGAFGARNSSMRLCPESNRACFMPFFFVITSDKTSLPDLATAGRTLLFIIGKALFTSPDRNLPRPLPL